MAQNETLNLDVSRYLEEKAQGRVKILRINGVVYYARTVYDSATGKPVPNLINFDEESLSRAIEDSERMTKTLKEFQADVKSAPESEAAPSARKR